jgi:hypothetical protein
VSKLVLSFSGFTKLLPGVSLGIGQSLWKIVELARLLSSEGGMVWIMDSVLVASGKKAFD